MIVRRVFLTLTSLKDPTKHREYNAWHQLDYLRESPAFRCAVGRPMGGITGRACLADRRRAKPRSSARRHAQVARPGSRGRERLDRPQSTRVVVEPSPHTARSSWHDRPAPCPGLSVIRPPPTGSTTMSTARSLTRPRTAASQPPLSTARCAPASVLAADDVIEHTIFGAVSPAGPYRSPTDQPPTAPGDPRPAQVCEQVLLGDPALADAIAGLHVDFDNRGGACDRLDGRRGLTLRKLYPALLDIDVVRAQANNLAKLNNMVNYRF